MIIDSSAMVAVLRREPEVDRFNKLISQALAPKMSTASYLEVATVLDSARDALVSSCLDNAIRHGRIELVPVTFSQAYIARAAYRDFGRGSGHAARLNFGDCFSYALAKDLNEPLLFKGNNFSLTDVKRVE